MDDEESFELDADEAPLQVYALVAQAPALDNPLLAQVLREEFEHVEADGGEIRVTHPSLLGITDVGDPVWGSTLIRAAAAPPLADYATEQLPGAVPGLVAAQELPGVLGALEIVEDQPAYAPPEHRRAAFEAVVRAIASTTPALALAWSHSLMLTAPEPRDALWGFVGMRRVTADAEGTVVDTLGMDALDLPDVWCRFVGLDEDFVAAEIGRHARSIYNGTEFIANGDPVAFGELWFRASWVYGHDPSRRYIALIPDEAHRIGEDPGEGDDDFE